MSEAVQILRLDDLVEDDSNPNKMDDDKVAMLVEAVRRVGFLQPILVRSMGAGKWRIRDGHHRARAAREAGLTEVPAVVFEGGDADDLALPIGMNRLRGELDIAKVADRVTELVDLGWAAPDFVVAGLSESEVADMLAMSKRASDDLDGEVAAFEEAPVESRAPGAFVLELEFVDMESLKKAKKLLKRAAGKGNPLGVGLLRVLGEEE